MTAVNTRQRRRARPSASAAVPGERSRRQEGDRHPGRGPDDRRDDGPVGRGSRWLSKTFNPTTPSLRQLVIVDRSELWKGKPVKALTEGKTKTGGRNNHGRITARYPRRRPQARAIAWSTSSAASSTSPATVERLEYDPEPHRLHRADQVRRRRAGLHPGAAAPEGRRPGGRRRAGRRQAGQRHAARATCRSARSSTTSS